MTPAAVSPELPADPNRNPRVTAAEVERELAARLGVRKVVWPLLSGGGIHCATREQPCGASGIVDGTPATPRAAH